MCGILGSIGRKIPASLLDSLHHRGPDGQGLEKISVHGQEVWFAHTRLSILDLSPAGKQPMQSRDGRWWLTFNGEIYNHLDLRKGLRGPFRGHSDTETLLELIAERGVAGALPELNGMFAFAALDTREGKIYLVRDPFGIKPLYYASAGNTFSFASEVCALKKLGVVDGLDDTSLRLFLSLRYTPAPKTLWKGIKRLSPGHVLCMDVASGNHVIEHYITPTSQHFTGSLDDAADAYRQILRASIKRQLLSDVPVGVLLSGGIDSALVAAMAKDAGRDLSCFSVGFGENYPECELADAAETAQVLGLPFASVVVTPEQLKDALPNIVRSVEEPLGTTSIMPMWYLVKRARQDVTVVLTGQGTDEPWGGYRRYQVEMVRKLMPWAGFWRMLKAGVGGFPVMPETIERGLRTLAQSKMERRALEACALFSQNERELLIGDSSDGGASDIVAAWLDWLQAVRLAPAEQMMRMDARMNLADDLLLYGDKISMAVSLEARVPMLDVELVGFVESLPLAYRLALRRSKIVHKRMAERYLPARIIHRKKKGFQVPFGDWSRGIWKDWIAEKLLDSGQPHLGVIRKDGLEVLWQQHLQRRPDRSRQVFALLMLALWWEEQ